MKNRRNKIVNLFKVGILLFGVSLLLWNCEQEDVLETEKKEFVIKEHSLEDLKINTKFTSTLKLLESRKVASSKNVNSTDIYNFTIVPNNIKEVILEGITSYTLLVKRPFSTPDYFENLVIQLKEGEETKAYIIKYTPNNTVELFEEHNSFNYEGKSSVFPLNLNNLDIFSKGTTGECAPILQTWCSWDTDHVAGPSCYEANDGRLYRKYVENTNCFESGDISYGGGGGSSTTNEPDSGDVIVTSPKTWDGTPTTINEGELLASRINSILDFSLSPSELNWLEVKLIEANEIKNFLETNKNPDYTYPEETTTFAEQAIEALMDGGEVDFEDRLILDNSFTSNEKVKCVYDKMKNISNNYFSEILSSFDNNKESQLKFKIEDIPQNNPDIYYNAKTLPRYNGGIRTFDIVLDKQFVDNSTSLEIALTLIHESIHAEIMERCIQLGIIEGLTYSSSWEASVRFSTGEAISTNLSDIIFANLLDKYSSYGGPPANGNWQHDIFSAFGYRERIKEDLKNIHLWLDDDNAPFIDNLNTGTIIDMNLDEFFNYISWLGLEGTEDYENLSNIDITKKEQAYNQMQRFYNENCN